MSDAHAAKRVRVVVHGRVQGVFFRGSTEEQAALAGVAGWVRNRTDGTVEAVFEGAPTAVARMLEFVQQGPPWAGVDRVEVYDEPLEGLRDFGVRR